MTSGIRSYRDLIVWQKSVELSVACYTLTRRFPASERYGPASQVQRTAVSIPANIAEGYGKSGPSQYLSHLSHARGSLRELETLLIIASRVGHGLAESYRILACQADEVGRMLYSLSTKIAASTARGVPEA